MQLGLQLYDPLEPRPMPQDTGAWFTINRLIPGQRLKDGSIGEAMRESFYPLSQYADRVTAYAGAVNTYVSQGMFAIRRRSHINLSWATHALVDLDFYTTPYAGQTPSEMLNEIIWHCEDEEIPLPSVVLYSGRGLYLKWFWSKPIPNAEAGRALAVNRALVKRLTKFGADAAAVDMARILRLCGTVNGKTGRPVEIIHLRGTEDAPLTYDFDAFARAILPVTTDAAPEGGMRANVVPMRPRTQGARRPGMFSREGWHWGVVRDLRTLAARHYPNGIVQEGKRDLYAVHLACQLAQVVPYHVLAREVEAAARTLLPAGYVERDMKGHLSAVLARAKRAAEGELVEFRGGLVSPVYTYSKTRIMAELGVTPDDEPHMTRLISDDEKERRRVASRRAAGMVERAAYEARAAERRDRARALKDGGLSWAEVAERMGLPSAGAARVLASRA